MKFKITIVLLAAFLHQTISFAQTNVLLKYLPENASMIIAFNTQRIGSKIPGETFRQSIIYQEMMKDSSKLPINAFFMGTGQSGINFSNGFLLAIVQDTAAGHLHSYVHIFGELKNEELFSSLMKKLFANDPIQVFGTNKIIFKAGNMIAWNKEVFVISSGNDNNWMTGIELSNEDSNRVKDMEMKKKRELCFYLLTPRPNNLFNTDSRFIDLMNTPGDIKTWNNGKANNNFGINPFSKMTEKFRSLTGTSKATIINFENGKIVVQSRSYLPEPVAAVYRKYPAVRINTDMTRHLPHGKLLALMLTSYNPEMGGELAKANDWHQLLDSMKLSMPFDFSLVSSSFKNNVMLAVIKAEEGAAVDSITQKMGGIEILMVLPIADKASFEKLKTSMARLWDSLQNKEGFAKTLKGFTPAARYNDQFCVISSSAQVAAAFLDNPGHETPPEWLQEYSSKPMVMAVDIQSIFNLVIKAKMHGNPGLNEKTMLDKMDKIISYGGDYENGGLNTTVEFKFTNQNENALKQIFDMISSMEKTSEKEKMKRENEDKKAEKN